jgi:ABC-type lipoprotein release transport system permease subunit
VLRVIDRNSLREGLPSRLCWTTSVASRVQEMAIRMALGSQRSGIVRLILVSGLKLASIGAVLGLAGAAAASGVLRSFLFPVSPFDPVVMALAASALPALRAAFVNPMQALREQVGCLRLRRFHAGLSRLKVAGTTTPTD